MWDQLWLNANILTKASSLGLDVIHQAAIAIQEEKIVWLGKMSELSQPAHTLAKQIFDAKQQWITPGLIDCHTHLVYAGDRAHEFEQRLGGQSYAEIANAGGGIQCTVQQTRAASAELLYQQSVPRLKASIAGGVTTLEIKSGYGLTLESERKLLQVARKLGEDFPVTIQTTFLGAHVLPLEYQDRADDYIDLICNEMLPTLADEKLIDAVDVFCETIAFTPAQTERVFQAAAALGLPVKCHADQLSDQGAAGLAARYHALSVDHLEFVSEKSLLAMAAAGTVAVLLPGAFYYLRETQKPPIDRLRYHKIPMAIATDCNPGTSPTTNLPMMMNMACVLFGLQPAEAWSGVTSVAASALGLQNEVGQIAVGYFADFLVWDFTAPINLIAEIGSYRQPTVIVYHGQTRPLINLFGQEN